MNTKYIFLDIDGTLVDGNGIIPDSAAMAINTARSNGHKIFICSGRSRCEMHENIMKVPLDGIIGSAGAYVEIDGKVVFDRPMTPDMNKKLFDYFLPKRMALFLETNDEFLVNDVGYDYVFEYIAWCKGNDVPYDKELFDLIKRLDNLEEHYDLPLNKLLFVTNDYTLDQVKADMSADFTVVDSGIRLPGNSGELSEPGMNKGRGIEFLIDHYNADMKDTIGVGDGENDMEMLKACEVGIAMGNANPVLKEIADYVTTDVNEDGLKNAFIHYGLI